MISGSGNASAQEEWRRFTPEVLPDRCMARVWNGGRGGQCTQLPAEDSKVCSTHAKSCVYGLVDGPIPAERLKAFLRGSAASGKRSSPSPNPSDASLPIPVQGSGSRGPDNAILLGSATSARSVSMHSSVRERSPTAGSDAIGSDCQASHSVSAAPSKAVRPSGRRRLNVVGARSRSRSRPASSKEHPARTTAPPAESISGCDLSVGFSADAYKRTESDWALQPEYLSRYEIHSLMGEGSFGKVFKGCDLETGSPVAIKAMKPQRLAFIKREVYILSILAGKPNIIHLLNVAIDWMTEVPFLIFEYVDHEDYSKLFPKITPSAVVDYTYQLLVALHHCRCHSIMHRDIKPANVVYRSDIRRLKLIDWGTAEIYVPGKDLTYRVGTRVFRAPELLAGYVHYDFSVDMWSLGCIVWQAAFGTKESMVPYGSDEVEQLKNITQILGVDAFTRFMTKLSTERHRLSATQRAEVSRGLPAKGRGFASRKDIQSNKKLRALCDMGVLSLLSNIFSFDSSARLTPQQAMKHDFFKNRLETAV